MKTEACEIINAAIAAALPYKNTVKLITELFPAENNITVIAVGKAACPMAKAAEDVLGDKIATGLLVTKYSHSDGWDFSRFEVIEASHPVSDDNSILAAQKGLKTASSLGKDDVLLVLLSGGGSALFELSKVSPEIQRDVTRKLLSRGACIDEINAIRKRLSLVKGGLLASAAFPAKVVTVALSDVLSNDKSVIASGLTAADKTDTDQLQNILNKYLSDIPQDVRDLILTKDDICINDGGYYFAGDINILCDAAGKKAEELGFTVHHKSRCLTGEAREEAVRIIENIPALSGRHCYIFGGETVVTLKGNGKGGRNQEMALAAAVALKDRKGIAFASAGSDGTDGPTDDAGGYADGGSFFRMTEKGIDPEKELDNNNSNLALKAAGDIITTGPTGTNVNDIMIVLTEKI